MSDERSAGSRPGPKTESRRPGDPAEPQDVAPAAVTIVDENVSVVVDPSSAADRKAADGTEILAMSERLRKVEEELAGVFETVGRLLGRIEGLESERRGNDDPA